VALLHGGGLEVPRLLFALRTLGAVLLPLNARQGATEIVYQLGDSAARWLVHDGAGHAATGRESAERAGGVGTISTAGGAPCLETEPRLARSAGQHAGVLALLYTSGTTGRPKGALLGAEAFRASAAASQRLLGREAGERWLLCMPLYHVGGLAVLLRSALAGGCAILQPRFDPDDVLRALDEEGVTGVSLVSTMLARLLDSRGARPAPPSLRCVLLGGGPTPVPLIERARALGYPVAPTYGLTEAASQVATRPPGDDRPPLDARLRALPGTELRIVDTEGRTLGAGESGEILVRGPTLMRGYHGRPEETRRALAGGWLHTGDLGRLDEDGCLTVHDRRDDLIVSGGENVYPAEIEAVLCAHPAIAEAAVAGRIDPEFGSRPVAWWTLDANAAVAPPSQDDLERWCRAHLAAYKVPVAFHRARALPRTPTGKLSRRDLRD
jgi:O-succinylbenzoic acid--CoA ligase